MRGEVRSISCFTQIVQGGCNALAWQEWQGRRCRMGHRQDRQRWPPPALLADVNSGLKVDTFIGFELDTFASLGVISLSPLRC